MTESTFEIWPGSPATVSGYRFVRLIEVTRYSRRAVYQESVQGGHVLVEEIHPDICALDGFDRHYQEHMERVAMIGHPACLRVLSHGCVGTGSYLILREWVEGPTLDEWTRGQACDPAVVFPVCVEIGWAISAMHDKGVGHGALDGSQVWLGPNQKPMLDVFQVSTVVESFLQENHRHHHAAAAGDIRALAGLAYVMLTGHAVPVSHDGMFFPPYLSPHAKQVISGAYAVPPAPVYVTMAGFCSDLLQIACAPTPFDSPASGGLKKPTSHFVAVMVCILILVGLTGFLAYRQIFGSAVRQAEAVSGGAPAVAADSPGAADEIVLTDEIPVLEPVEDDGQVVMIEEEEEDNADPEEPATRSHSAARTLPTPPPPRVMAGDAFIYAAHFYFGDQVGLLKLQFGNAGAFPLDVAELSFQCAFSVDDKLDALLPASAGAVPSDGQDLAAGGFTGTWLGMSLQPMAPNRKSWMRQTFRIDTSNRDVFEHAKFLIVRISPFYRLEEANYTNNTIAIPLENPNQWNTSTLDPKDLVEEPGADAEPQAAGGEN